MSPPEDLTGDIATIRALGEDLSRLSAQLETVETTLELNTFSLELLTARSTGRLYTMADDLREKVEAAYGSVAPVEAALGEIANARRGLKSAVSKALLFDPSPGPSLPPESPLWPKLRSAVEKAEQSIRVATMALLKVGYPDAWEQIRRKFIESPEGPKKEESRAILTDALGFEDADLRGVPPRGP